MKSKKKKIPSSSKPKTSHYVRISKSKETVVETQHAEELVATADILKGIDVSESSKDIRNRPKTVDAKKHETKGAEMRRISWLLIFIPHKSLHQPKGSHKLLMHQLVKLHLPPRFTQMLKNYQVKRDDPLPITKFNYKVRKASKIATMRIKRNNQPPNPKIYDNFILEMLGFTEWLELYNLASKRQNATNDQFLKNMKAKFKWVATTADKLRLPPPPQLTAFELPPTEKKRKRRVEVIHEVFVKLIRIQNLIRVDSEYAQEVYNNLIYEIESTSDFLQAREIVEKNVDGLGMTRWSIILMSNLNGIQVKDIVKEVEDYLKTYSSAEMDMSWYVDRIRRRFEESQG
nr:hypothetical protein [Tanacetum cinerariifolium]